MLKKQKEQIVEKLTEDFQNGNFAFFDFSEINAELMDEFRRLTHDQEIKATVVKRKLVIKALEQNKITADLPTGFYMVINSDDEILPFKFIKNFIKDKEKGAFQGGIFENKWIDADEAQKIADLPSKDELKTKLVFLLNSPLQNLHYNLSYNLKGLINILKQRSSLSS